MSKKIFTLISGILITLIIIAASFFISRIAMAEQSGGSPESGATSHLKTIYNSLVALGHGSDAAGGWGDWGAYLNRLRSAGEWVPSDSSTVTDVKNTKTFHSTSRTQLTGTYPNPSNCSTQQWHDSSGSATEGNNCSLSWTDAAVPIVGQDDNRSAPLGGYDPRTGLTWSQYLKNNAGGVEFAASGGSTWNWNGSIVFTVTAANATAGATYTNNGQTFTVVTTIVAGTSLNATATGSPAASGTLTKTSGTGDATITFSATAAGTNNVAVGMKTATQLCSDRGNGWRLPSQKELMQAYIDGSNWNLTNPANNFWSFTEYDATIAWAVYLSYGVTYFNVKATYANYVRCVR